MPDGCPALQRAGQLRRLAIGLPLPLAPGPHPHRRRLPLHGRRRRLRPLQRPRPSHDVHLRMRPGLARMQSRRLPVLRQDAQPTAGRARQRRQNSDDLILQGFVQEYGPTVIAAPTATGFNRVAWIMPFVALALGIAFVVYVVRSWKNRPEPALADGITIPQGQRTRRVPRKGPQGDRRMTASVARTLLSAKSCDRRQVFKYGSLERARLQPGRYRTRKSRALAPEGVRSQ